ncbi:FkbM family methyltransferase [Opitutaceae bacterium TAV4]|nr:FkbM family methyltransferase [Opitutaceae bacterium TAV4]RRK00562.1 FkbM family methyltransferase [Opitutaceae bacterium TAV3]RRK01978.1 FkbM family methyltransferase [Opitutaceae bacterium TAV3]
MIPASEAEFGRHAPGNLLRTLIRLAQNVPRNWLGQQFAQMVRKIVIYCSTLPVDVEVGPIKMRCYIKDNNSEKKFIFMPWRFDRIERGLLCQSLPQDGCFLDIGANVGIYTLTVAAHLGVGGRIVAFEPNPPAFNRLCFNIHATKTGHRAWPEITPLPLGVSDAAGEFRLHLDSGNLGGSSIVRHGDARTAKDACPSGYVNIPCKPLLVILKELKIRRVDAIKIDIEGAEDMALVPYLENAPDELLPNLIIIENSEHQWRRDLVGALARKGYTRQTRSRMNTVYRRG